MTNNNPSGNQEPTYPKIVDRRLKQLRLTMDEHKVEALVVTYLPNIRYLTNFSGSAATLFIMEDELHFITDDRYEEQIKTELFELPNLSTHISRNVWQYAKDNKILDTIGSLGFEADRMSYSNAVNIRNLVRPIKFKPAPNAVEPFTQPKSPEELVYIQKSCDIAVAVYNQMLEFIKPGMSENEIAIEIAYQTRKLGSEADPFDIIVTSGPRGALVHGKPSDRKIKKNDIVLLDFGCKVNGFCSDITRTIAVGKATKEQKAIYSLLRTAEKAAIEGVRPGMNGKILDAFARDMIIKAGYGDFFQHSLGHGIGLEAHEMPTITFRLDDQNVPEDAVLAIEPGIYLPEKFGMRVEDCMQVTKSGGRYLTNAPEELPVI